MSNSAVISPCGQYRYLLTRQSEVLFPERGRALFVMLNPSTADATVDDRTIGRCKGFARAWQCPGLVVANLYAFRATNPKRMLNCSDPVGPENDEWLRSLAKEHGDVVCAWGVNAGSQRVAAVVEIFRSAGARLFCLGVTKDGAPRHPLYVKGDQPLIPFIPREVA